MQCVDFQRVIFLDDHNLKSYNLRTIVKQSRQLVYFVCVVTGVCLRRVILRLRLRRLRLRYWVDEGVPAQIGRG